MCIGKHFMKAVPRRCEHSVLKRRADSMGEPIRIAQVVNRMDSGGIEMVLMNYYQFMDHNRVQFDFYYANDSSFPQKRELQKLGAGTYPIPAYSKPLAFHRALYSAFKEKGYQIVHVHLNTMSVFALFAAWCAGVPVRICHNHSTAHWSEGKVTLLKYLLRPLNKVFANRYFACGRAAGQWLYGKHCMESGKVTVIPNAIDTKRFLYDPAARQRLRRELGIDEGTFVVGHVGRFRHQKNHRFMLTVFKAVLSRRPDSVLLLIGDGEKLEEIQALADEMGIASRVIFAGVRSDVDKLYSVMDVFCLPSYYEGMPLVAWEAQCNGLPCVLADTVTPEAKRKPNVEFVPLTGEEAWVETIQRLQRSNEQMDPSIDLEVCGKRLEQIYLKETGAASREC